MNKARAARHGVDVVNTSVTELMLLAIFFILLALALARADLFGAETDNDSLRSLIKSQTEEISQLQQRLDAMKKSIGLTPSELQETLFQARVRLDDLKVQFEALKTEAAASRLAAETIKRDLQAVRAERDKLAAEIGPLRAAAGSLAELNDNVAAIKRIAAANNIDPDKPLTEIIARLDDRLGGLSESVGKLTRKLKDAGLTDSDLKKVDGEVYTARCWINDNGSADTLFRIRVRSDGLSLIPAWPKNRQPDADASRWIIKAADSGLMRLETFRQLGSEIAEEAKKRRPSCVFIVDIRAAEDNPPSLQQMERARSAARQFFYTN